MSVQIQADRQPSQLDMAVIAHCLNPWGHPKPTAPGGPHMFILNIKEWRAPAYSGQEDRMFITWRWENGQL